MRRPAVLAACVVAVSALAGPAAADVPSADVTACHDAITVLVDATGGADLLHEKDRTGLLGKLSSADRKLSQHKWADAYTNLTAYRDKAATLQSAGKLATDLAAQATATIDGSCAWLVTA